MLMDAKICEEEFTMRNGVFTSVSSQKILISLQKENNIFAVETAGRTLTK